METELGFIMGKTPVAAPGQQLTTLQVWQAVDSVVGCLELCANRAQPEAAKTASVYEKISDFALNFAVVVGTPKKKEELDVMTLDSVAVQLSLDGQLGAEGTSSNVLGNPLTSLTWLANHLRERGTPIRPGQLIISGNIANARAGPGQTCSANFSRGFGSVSVSLK